MSGTGNVKRRIASRRLFSSDKENQLPQENIQVSKDVSWTWLLSPKTSWTHSLANRSSDDDVRSVKGLTDHVTQELQKLTISSVSSTKSKMAPNYMSWVGSFGPDDPQGSALIHLQILLTQFYKASLIACKLPYADFLFTRSDSVSDPPEVKKQLEKTYRRRRAHFANRAGMTHKAVMASQATALTQLNHLHAAVNKTAEVIGQGPSDTAGQNADEAEDDVTAEEKDGISKSLEAQNKSGRRVLVQLISDLVTRGQVSKYLPAFVYGIVEDKELDVSRLEPRDLEFLVNDTHILRMTQKEQGALVYQLNDLTD